MRDPLGNETISPRGFCGTSSLGCPWPARSTGQDMVANAAMAILIDSPRLAELPFFDFDAASASSLLMHASSTSISALMPTAKTFETQRHLNLAIRALVKQDERLTSVVALTGMPPLRRRESG